MTIQHNRQLLNLLWLFLFCLGPSPAGAVHTKHAKIHFSPLPHEYELVQNSIRAITQDHQGFLWIGTLGGLHRFDGTQMILLNDLNLSGTSLDIIQVESLNVDSRGDLWIGGTNGGLNKIRMADGSIESFSDLTRPLASGKYQTISNICQDSNGIVWISTNPGILRLDPVSRSIQEFEPDCSSDWKAEANILLVSLDDGLFLISNTSSVGLYDESENSIYEIPFEDGSFLNETKIRGIYKLDDGSLWVSGTNSFLAEIKGKGQQRFIDPHSLPGAFDFIELVQDINSKLWMRTPGGKIAIYNPTTQNFHLQELEFDGRVFQERGWLSCLFSDRTGVMWLGAESYGLVFNDPSSTRFQKLSGRSRAPGNFQNPYLWDIKKAKAGVFLAGRYELGFMDSKTHTYHRLINILEHPILSQCEDLFCIQPLDNNRILMGHTFNSPGVFDLRDSSYTPLDVDYIGPLRAFKKGKNNRIWVLGTEGCLLLDQKTLQQIKLPAALVSITQNKELRTMVEDDNGILWFGSQYQGLIRYNPVTESTMTWNQGDGPNDLSHPGVRSLHLDSHNNLWVGTYGGLIRISVTKTAPPLGNLHIFTTADGLPNNTIYDILPGTNETMWLSTNRGLSHFDPATGIFRNYEQNDGLANNEFNGGAALIGPQGWAYFGGVDGVTWFKPGKEIRNLIVPMAAVTRLVTGDTQEYPTFETPLVDEILLDWDQNTLEVNLAALCFQQPSKQQISYRIPEVDPAWWTASRDQTIRVTNLPDGDLHFEFKASNNDGIWSEKKVLLLHVGTPPWRTPLAITLYIFIALLILWALLFRYQRQQAQKKSTMQQLALADKLTTVGQLAAGMAHDFNNQLQIIMGNAEILKIEIEPSNPGHESLETIISTGQRAGFLASRLLVFAKDTAPVRTTLNLDEVINDLQYMIASFLGARIDLKFAPGIGDKMILANREQIEHVLMNLCLNSRDAIIGNGTIVIMTSLIPSETGDQMCVFEVRDSGKGISDSDLKHIFEPFFTTKEAGKGSGLGLSMVNRIIQKHGGRMEVSQNRLGGTTFKTMLPVSHEQLKIPAESPVPQYSKKFSGITALVADDEPAVNKISSGILKKAGFTVISVKNGKEGIEALDTHPEIKIAILDVIMPVLDGRAVYEHIKKTHRQIPVLFCSGFSFSALKESEFKELDVPVLAKPFSASELLAAISELPIEGQS